MFSPHATCSDAARPALLLSMFLVIHKLLFLYFIIFQLPLFFSYAFIVLRENIWYFYSVSVFITGSAGPTERVESPLAIADGVGLQGRSVAPSAAVNFV